MKVMWLWSLFLSLKVPYCIILALLLVMWGFKMPAWGDEVRWWCRHCDIVLGYCWPSGDSSEGLSALCDAAASHCDDVGGRGSQRGSTRFRHASQNGMQFKTYELFTSRIFHLIFSAHSWSQITETVESETTGSRGPVYFHCNTLVLALSFPEHLKHCCSLSLMLFQENASCFQVECVINSGCMSLFLGS